MQPSTFSIFKSIYLFKWFHDIFEWDISFWYNIETILMTALMFKNNHLLHVLTTQYNILEISTLPLNTTYLSNGAGSANLSN